MENKSDQDPNVLSNANEDVQDSIQERMSGSEEDDDMSESEELPEMVIRSLNHSEGRRGAHGASGPAHL